MFTKRILRAMAATALIGASGGTAMMAAHAVSTRPEPVYVSQITKHHDPATEDRAVHRKDTAATTTTASTAVPSSTTSPAPDDHRGQGADDPATHDAGDDHGNLTDEQGADDPAGHDAGDDHGDVSGGHGTDDPAGHDAGDDHGGGDDNGGHGSDG